MQRIVGIVLAAVGVLLVVAGAVVRFAVAPAVAVLPSNTDVTRVYTGTARTMFNAAALTGTGSPLLHDVPIRVVHHTKVLAAKGGNALVFDAKLVSAGGKPVASVDYHYAVDRTTLGTGSGYTGVVRQNGISFNWPVRTARHDYTGWVSDTHRTTTLKYTGTTKRGGVTTYVFTTATAPQPITDSQVLAGLPRSMPIAQLVRLAEQLNLPAATVQQLQPVLATLPAVVPFHYTYQVTGTYWVAPHSGVVVDVREHEVRTLVFPVNGRNVPISAVLDMTFGSPAATLRSAAHDASDKSAAIDLIYLRLPLGLVIGGAALVVAGVVVLLIRRRPAAHGGPTGSHERIEPLGTRGA